VIVATQQTYCVFVISGLSQETKELLLDYVEKYVMTCLDRILFCPPSTADEEKDLSLQNRYDSVLHLPWNIRSSVLKTLGGFTYVDMYFYDYSFGASFCRIRQLNWVNSQHLDCRINERKSEVCDLVYTAIAGM
jgi:hypothetical protein